MRVCVAARPRSLVTCSLPRLFASPLPAGRLSLSVEESRHATRVLRLLPGDGVELFDGDGACVAARIVAVSARGVAEVEPCAAPVSAPWVGPRWTVAIACSGLSQRADWAVEKCAELGVASFIPLLTERSAASKQRRAEQSAESLRWERLSVAASKQCLRLHSLKVAPATTLSDLLPAVSASQLSLVALQGGAPLREVLAAHSAAARAGGLLIVGPPVRCRVPCPTSGPVFCANACTFLAQLRRATSQTARRRPSSAQARWASAWVRFAFGRRRLPCRWSLHAHSIRRSCLLHISTPCCCC
jgi:16S rRNA (uracil1498-N3)-methyltransferase